MTIDEFEEWINSPTNGPDRSGISYMSNLQYMIRHIEDEVYYGPVLRLKIKEVTPHEDRDFLTLKYSNLL